MEIPAQQISMNVEEVPSYRSAFSRDGIVLVDREEGFEVRTSDIQHDDFWDTFAFKVPQGNSEFAECGVCNLNPLDGNNVPICMLTSCCRASVCSVCTDQLLVNAETAHGPREEAVQTYENLRDAFIAAGNFLEPSLLSEMRRAETARSSFLCPFCRCARLNESSFENSLRRVAALNDERAARRAERILAARQNCVTEADLSPEDRILNSVVLGFNMIVDIDENAGKDFIEIDEKIRDLLREVVIRPAEIPIIAPPAASPPPSEIATPSARYYEREDGDSKASRIEMLARINAEMQDGCYNRLSGDIPYSCTTLLKKGKKFSMVKTGGHIHCITRTADSTIANNNPNISFGQELTSYTSVEDVVTSHAGYVSKVDSTNLYPIVPRSYILGINGPHEDTVTMDDLFAKSGQEEDTGLFPMDRHAAEDIAYPEELTYPQWAEYRRAYTEVVQRVGTISEDAVPVIIRGSQVYQFHGDPRAHATAISMRARLQAVERKGPSMSIVSGTPAFLDFANSSTVTGFQSEDHYAKFCHDINWINQPFSYCPQPQLGLPAETVLGAAGDKYLSERNLLAILCLSSEQVVPIKRKDISLANKIIGKIFIATHRSAVDETVWAEDHLRSLCLDTGDGPVRGRAIYVPADCPAPLRQPLAAALSYTAVYPQSKYAIKIGTLPAPVSVIPAQGMTQEIVVQDYLSDRHGILANVPIMMQYQYVELVSDTDDPIHQSTIAGINLALKKAGRQAKSAFSPFWLYRKFVANLPPEDPRQPWDTHVRLNARILDVPEEEPIIELLKAQYPQKTDDFWLKFNERLQVLRSAKVNQAEHLERVLFGENTSVSNQAEFLRQHGDRLLEIANDITFEALDGIIKLDVKLDKDAEKNVVSIDTASSTGLVVLAPESNSVNLVRYQNTPNLPADWSLCGRSLLVRAIVEKNAAVAELLGNATRAVSRKWPMTLIHDTNNFYNQLRVSHLTMETVRRIVDLCQADVQPSLERVLLILGFSAEAASIGGGELPRGPSALKQLIDHKAQIEVLCTTGAGRQTVETAFRHRIRRLDGTRKTERTRETGFGAELSGRNQGPIRTGYDGPVGYSAAAPDTSGPSLSTFGSRSVRARTNPNAPSWM